MAVVKIESISESGKSILTPKRERFFVPTDQRDKVKVGQFAVVTSESFTKQRNEAGDLEDKEWTRQTVAFVGSMKEAIVTDRQDLIIAAVTNSVVAEHVKAEYNVALPSFDALVS